MKEASWEVLSQVEKAEVILGRTRRLSVRLTTAYLTLADDRGRVLVLDLEYGQLRRDVRL